MISEKNFAKHYSSFWNEHTPWLQEYYASENASGRRIAGPVKQHEETDFVSINNIIATTHYKNICNDPGHPLEESFRESLPIARRYPGSKWAGYELTELHREIIHIQVNRLDGQYGSMVKHDPFFPGCGIMSSCRGDLISGQTLVEVKAQKARTENKPFRIEDFRQLIVYCALNYLAGEKYKITKINLFNPRLGYLWSSDLEEFIYIISNSTSAELFENLGNYLTESAETIDY